MMHGFSEDEVERIRQLYLTTICPKPVVMHMTYAFVRVGK